MVNHLKNNEDLKISNLEFKLISASELFSYLPKIEHLYQPGVDTFRPPFFRSEITSSCWYEGVLVGLCKVRPKYNTITIFIESTFRRKGIGKRLLSMVCKEAKSRNIHFLAAIINPANPASGRLFRRYGFSKIGSVYLENLPFEGLGINQKPGARVVKILALDVFGTVVANLGKVSLRLSVPFSKFLNHLITEIIKRDNFLTKARALTKRNILNRNNKMSITNKRE